MLKKYKELLNLDATIAKDLFESCNHPWEVLPLIKDFILKLIPTLGDEYEEVDENVYVHKEAKVAKSACIVGPTIICKGAEIRHCAYIRGNVIVGDKFSFSVKSDVNVITEMVWESSNTSVVNIDQNGNATALSSGNVIVTVYVKDYPYITDSVIVRSTSKVEQTGVGTGLSKDDPIFLGNEGEEEPLEIYFIEMQHIYADSIYIKKGNVDILIDSGYEYDGEFVGKEGSVYSKNETGFISGGTFNVDVEEELVADGLTTTEDGNGNYVIGTPASSNAGNSTNVKNPDTSDGVFGYIALALISVLAMSSCVILKKRFN